MRGAGGELLLLLLLAGSLCSSQDYTIYKGIKGEDVTLPPKVNGSLLEIIWKKQVKNMLNKVAEWDGTLHLYSQLMKRAEIDSGSGNLTIKNILPDTDSGKYIAEALVGESYQTTYVRLEILEPPSAPNLTCTIEDNGIDVNCMLMDRYELPVSFHLRYTDMNDISNVNSTEEHASIKLPTNTDRSKNITCTIVASKTAVSTSISLMTCDSSGASPKRGRVGLIVALTLILASVIVFGVFLWRKKDLSEKLPDESMPVRETDPVAETMETSRAEDLSEKLPDESTPLREADPVAETMKTSSTEDITASES